MVNLFMPRDSLGRIMYEGDVIRSTISSKPINHLPLMFSFGMYSELILINEIVDLDASPSHTNYERYFADLGTFEDVDDALWGCPCITINCDDCPYYRWGELFYHMWQESYSGGCWMFEEWLGDKAVI